MIKKVLAASTAAVMLLTGCTSGKITETTSSKNNILEIDSDIITSLQPETDFTFEADTDTGNSLILPDTESEEYIKNLGFTSLNDDNLIRYVEDTVYSDLVTQLNSDEYFVENVEAVYVSKEYLEELEYNSQENIYFGYTLSELEEIFQGEKFIFTLGENGQTEVQLYEEYDDTYDKVIRNIAIGSGVILFCVTVSVVTAGVGIPAVSMIFAASAKSATTFALSSGAISGISAGIIESYKTHDFDKAIKAAALKGSEEFMLGAIFGAAAGGAQEAYALKGATLNGLTINEAATIQKQSKYPLDVIKEFQNMEQFEICQKAGLSPGIINGKTALIRKIDPNYIDEATGMTNLEKMQKGLAPLDSNGIKYELHHVGQKTDSTLAILTEEEHRLGDNYSIWHKLENSTEVHGKGNTWNSQKEAFWKTIAKQFN